MDELVHTYRGEGWLEIRWRSIWVTHHYAGPASDDRVSGMVRDLKAFAQECQPIVFVLVVSGKLPPGRAARALFDRFLAEHQQHICHSAVWIRRDGMIGSILRSVATNLVMLGAFPIRSTFLSSREDLVRFLIEVGEHQDAAEAAVAAVLRPIEPRAEAE